jgi:hypothetical protein
MKERAAPQGCAMPRLAAAPFSTAMAIDQFLDESLTNRRTGLNSAPVT